MIHLESGDGSIENSKKNQKWIFHLPGVGLRIIRSLCAVFLCIIIFTFMGSWEGAFISGLVALQCVQPYTENRWKLIKESLAATAIAAFGGFLALLILNMGNRYIFSVTGSYGQVIGDALIIVIFLGIVLYGTVAVGLKNLSFFSCMVYLCIAMTSVAEKNALLITGVRVFDTVTGILMAAIVSSVYLPRAKNKDILFVSGIDDTLLSKDNKLSPYSRIELNRLIEDGARFTLSTMRTPASLMESVSGLRLNIPVIVMDGAALYDINENSYLLTYMISYQNSVRIMKFLDEKKLNSFINVVIDDLLVIYYGHLKNDAERDIYKKMRKSPYRNYVDRKLPENENVVYFMVIDKKEIISQVYAELVRMEWILEYKVLTYDSDEYPGYAYIKIYNKEATRENMMRNLKAMLDMEKSMTFGSIPGKYDVLIEDSDHSMLVKKLKKIYAPICLFQSSKSKKERGE